MRIATSGILAAILLAAPALCPAPALAADKFADCYQYTLTPEVSKQGIAICTRLINSGRHKGSDMAVLLSNRSLGYVKTDQFDLAMADLDRAIAIKSDYVFAHSQRADLLRMRGDLDGAITALNTTIRIDPSFIVAYYDRGQVYEARNDPNSARASYQLVIDLPGKNRPIDKWAKEQARAAIERLGKEK